MADYSYFSNLNLDETEEDKVTRDTGDYFFNLDLPDLGKEDKVTRDTGDSSSELEGPSKGGFESQFMYGDNYRKVRDYMDTNLGMSEKAGYTREEIVDAYVTNMRRFSAGQSVVTISELSKLYNAGDNLQKYTDAYKLWDEASGVFSSESGSTLAEKAEGVYDYARAAIVDPANIAAPFFGKLSGMAAGKVVAEGGKKLAAREVADRAIEMSMAAAARDATAKGLSAEAKTSAIAKARASAVDNLIKQTIPEGKLYQKALQKAYKAEVIGGAAVETLTSGGVNLLYQDAMITANVQEEFNPVEFAIATFVPAAFTGAGMALAKGSTKATRLLDQQAVNLALDASHQNYLRYISNLKAEGLKRASSREISEGVKQAAKDGMDNWSSWLDKTWKEKVESGAVTGDLTKNLDTKEIQEIEALRYFINGERSLGVSGVLSKFYDGVSPELAESLLKNTVNFTDFYTSVLKKLDPAAQKEVVDLFNTTIGSINPDRKLNDVNRIADYIASRASLAGSELNVFSVSKQDFSKVFEARFSAEEWFNDFRKGQAPEVSSPKKAYDTISKMQKSYVRMLVTHPGTTFLNVAGWSMMSSINAVNNTLRGTLYGSVGLVEALAKGSMDSATYVHKAAMEFGALKNQLSNLVNPYATYDQAMAYLAARPKARKELFKYIAGGVEVNEKEMLKELGIEGSEQIHTLPIDKLMQTFQVLYGVRAADFMSKTQSFAANIDRQVRRSYGQGYKEFLMRDDFYEIMTMKTSDKYKTFLGIEQRAINDTLRETFNKSHASNEGIGVIAKAVEEVAKWPIVGAVAPFGQFFNNTMALTADLTGASVIHHFFLHGLRNSGEDIERDMVELVGKMAIGWGILGMQMNKEYENMQKGLPWYAEREADGTIRDYRYDFPYSAFKGYGRMAAHLYYDGSVPEGLFDEVMDTVGFGSFSRGLNDTFGGVISGIKEYLRNPESEFKPHIIDMLGKASSQYMSGVTRALDPLNQVYALTKGEDYEAIDRSVGNKNWNNAIRYIDQFVDPFLEKVGPPISATTGKEPVQQTNRIFGFREIVTASTVERMFSEIGRPNWKTEIRATDPMAAKLMRETIFPILEYEAAKLMQSHRWDEMTLKEKERAVSATLAGAKSRMLESFRESYSVPDRKAAVIYDIFSSGLVKERRDNIIRAYGVDPDELWTLDLKQLGTLLYHVKGEAKNYRAFSKEFRESDY